jgi:hypothetical protein
MGRSRWLTQRSMGFAAKPAEEMSASFQSVFTCAP